MSLRVVPVTLKRANEFVAHHHRHNKPCRGHKFSLAVADETGIRGVAICGRPVARLLDDGLTLEISRTCTDGASMANGMLYGAARAAARALGYHRVVTYSQAGESGASLRGAGFVRSAELEARGSWADCTQNELKAKRDPIGSGGVARTRWEVVFARSARR
jgi:hypothetical protein